jgi:hypothetical protein
MPAFGRQFEFDLAETGVRNSTAPRTHLIPAAVAESEAGAAAIAGLQALSESLVRMLAGDVRTMAVAERDRIERDPNLLPARKHAMVAEATRVIGLQAIAEIRASKVQPEARRRAEALGETAMRALVEPKLPGRPDDMDIVADVRRRLGDMSPVDLSSFVATHGSDPYIFEALRSTPPYLLPVDGEQVQTLLDNVRRQLNPVAVDMIAAARLAESEATDIVQRAELLVAQAFDLSRDLDGSWA